MKTRPIVASLAATLLATGALIPIANANPEDTAPPTQTTTEQAAATETSASTDAESVDLTAPDAPETLGEDSSEPPASNPDEDGEGTVDLEAPGSDAVQPESNEPVKGTQETSEEADPLQPESEAGPAASEEGPVVAEFFPKEVVNECPETTAHSTLAGAVADYDAASHTVSVKIYLEDEVVLSGSPALDEDGYFTFPVKDLEKEGEYRAQVQVLVGGEPEGEVAEALLTVRIVDCDEPANVEFTARLSEDIRVSVDTTCKDPNSNVSVSGHVDDFDINVATYAPRVLVTVGSDTSIMVNTKGKFSGSLGFFAPGTYTATFQLQRQDFFQVAYKNLGDPVKLTFTVGDHDCGTPFSGDFTFFYDPKCLAPGERAAVTLLATFVAPEEPKNHRILATIPGTDVKDVKVWQGSYAGPEKFMYWFKDRLKAGTYTVSLRVQYDAGPFFFYWWRDLEPTMYYTLQIPTCTPGVGDGGSPEDLGSETGENQAGAETTVPTTAKSPGLAKTGATVLPVFLVGAMALGTGLALKVRRTKKVQG